MSDVHHTDSPGHWHVVLSGGHIEDLDQIGIEIRNNQLEAYEATDWSKKDQLTICLRWIDDAMPNLVLDIIEDQIGKLSAFNTIKYQITGRIECPGHEDV